MKTQFVADDGEVFDTEEICREYEAKKSVPEIIARMYSVSVVNAALKYDKTVPAAIELGAALEEAGRICAAARVAAGDAKRKRKAKTDGAPPMGEGKPPDTDSSQRVEDLVLGKNIGSATSPNDTGNKGAGAVPQATIGPATARAFPSASNLFPLHGSKKSTGE